jgi:predicted nuclease of predicted toxin-antitoxin system
MALFLIDSCLPARRIAEWQSTDFVYQRDLEATQPAHDFIIWRYAAEHGLTILTRDRDFADLMLPRLPPPRVVLFELGRMRLPEIKTFIARNWLSVAELSGQCKLVYVSPAGLEGVE